MQAGFAEAEAMQFLAQGMLINVLLGLGIPSIAPQDAEASALLKAACGPKLDFVLEYGA